MLEQLDLFNIDYEPIAAMDDTETIDIEPSLKVGDKVRCTVDLSDSETYYYLKHYYPNALTDVGEIENIDGNVVKVRFKNEIVLLEKHQVTM